MVGSSSSGEIRTPIFSGVNYEFWRTKLRTIFVSHDLWSLIEEGYVVPLSIVALIEAQTKELKENIKRDAKALGVIQNAILDEIFPRISNETSAKSAWDVLEKVYRGSTKIYDGKNHEQLLAKIEMRKSRSFPLTIEYATQSTLKMEVQEYSKNDLGILSKAEIRSVLNLQEVSSYG
ncbi:uncharacterized protein [Malus domestica]|uniref:uncharacterized protein n=1 Tax=Malus domestica TaxID=3750 RepID=UPI0039771D66